MFGIAKQYGFKVAVEAGVSPERPAAQAHDHSHLNARQVELHNHLTALASPGKGSRKAVGAADGFGYALPVCRPTDPDREAWLQLTLDNARRLADPNWQRAIEGRRSAIFDSAASQLGGALSEAVETLTELMQDEGAYIRLSAAWAVIQLAAAYRDATASEGRIAALALQIDQLKAAGNWCAGKDQV